MTIQRLKEYLKWGLAWLLWTLMQISFLYMARDFAAFYSAGFATGLGLAYTIISLEQEKEAEENV